MIVGLKEIRSPHNLDNQVPFMVLEVAGQMEELKVWAVDGSEAVRCYRDHYGITDTRAVIAEELCEETDVIDEPLEAVVDDGESKPLAELSIDASTAVVTEPESSDGDSSGEPDNAAGCDMRGTSSPDKLESGRRTKHKRR